MDRFHNRHKFYWIHACPSTLKTFVANRVSKIQRLTSRDKWYHVPSNQNPADILSRGTAVNDLKTSKLWWLGPDWICKREDWPEQPKKIIELPEVKVVNALGVTIRASIRLPEVSSMEKLVRSPIVIGSLTNVAMSHVRELLL